MSAPDTNVERQKKDHKPSLLGIGAAAIFGVAAIALLTLMVVDRASEDDTAELPATADEVQAVINGTAD
ncbi:hypothetical protein AB9K35_11900 [Leisingera sp. XS_AS12]|jgi:hypothetical protein|uniref:hypothetical protein n=1 Tax=unclassified Leisingera TaxID=2614906 RepID=UPI001C9890C2|nr:hypothetical protein [Nocardioides marinus]